MIWTFEMLFPSLLATADAGVEWALACADPERVGLFSGHKSAQSSIRIDFCDMSLARVTVGLGGVMGFLRKDCKPSDDTLLHDGQLQCHQRLHRSRRVAGYPLVSCLLYLFSYWLLAYYQYCSVMLICQIEMWWLELECNRLPKRSCGALLWVQQQKCVDVPQGFSTKIYEAKAALSSYSLVTRSALHEGAAPPPPTAATTASTV